jgi:hypothetical protein
LLVERFLGVFIYNLILPIIVYVNCTWFLIQNYRVERRNKWLRTVYLVYGSLLHVPRNILMFSLLGHHAFPKILVLPIIYF